MSAASTPREALLRRALRLREWAAVGYLRHMPLGNVDLHQPALPDQVGHRARLPAAFLAQEDVLPVRRDDAQAVQANGRHLRGCVDRARAWRGDARAGLIAQATILDNAPLLLSLAVLHASVAGRNMCGSLRTPVRPTKHQSLHYRPGIDSDLVRSNAYEPKKATARNQQRVE